MTTTKLEKTIVALDFSDKNKVQEFLNKFDWEDKAAIKPVFVKLGMELFYSEGPQMIELLKEKGLKIFLDLKVHDIPNTAYGAIKSLCKYGVDIFNVHAGGGIDMMKRAKDAVVDSNADAKLIAVTILTSMDEATLNNELNISGSVNDAVIRLAKNSYSAGMDGIVCSPLEAKIVKENTSSEFLTVCPGVRFSDGDSHDQKRIMTPDAAFENQADYIVMGRAITKAEIPAEALQRLV